ncbi:uncharacterized protein METZ01_LOCUS168344, partial [marine metagenome]
MDAQFGLNLRLGDKANRIRRRL